MHPAEPNQSVPGVHSAETDKAALDAPLNLRPRKHLVRVVQVRQKVPFIKRYSSHPAQHFIVLARSCSQNENSPRSGHAPAQASDSRQCRRPQMHLANEIAPSNGRAGHDEGPRPSPRETP